MSKSLRYWGTGALAATALTLGVSGWQTLASAGSDNSSDTYAADYTGMSTPAGTFVVYDYSGWVHADQFNQNTNNLLGKFGFATKIPADLSIWTDIERLTYVSSLWGHPFILSAAIPIVIADKVVLNGPPAPIGGPQTFKDGGGDPVIFATYGLIADPTIQRYLGFTTYLHLPINNYNPFRSINFSTPNQWTVIPQVGYSEGLGKFGLKNFWFDFIGNASIHSDGKNPFNIPLAVPGIGGFGYSTLSQDNSYDVKAFLRYSFGPAFWAAAGIEKSWGGNQRLSGGALQGVFGTTSFGTDDFLKGHIQASYPILPDFHVAVDLTHDFQAYGGFKEDFTAEVRFTKLFLPSVEPLK